MEPQPRLATIPNTDAPRANAGVVAAGADPLFHRGRLRVEGVVLPEATRTVLLFARTGPAEEHQRGLHHFALMAAVAGGAVARDGGGRVGEVLRRLARADGDGTGGRSSSRSSSCRRGGRSRSLVRMPQRRGWPGRVHGDICRVRLEVGLLVRLGPGQRARAPLLCGGAALPLQGLHGRGDRHGCGRGLNRGSGIVNHRRRDGSGHIG